ncbi:MAG: hypothetical protein ACRERX_22965 [Pseudomonas sp.]
MRSFLVLSLTAAVVAVLPVEANAQRRPRTIINDCCSANRFSLEPYGGAMKDAYDIGADDDVGYLVGFRVGIALSSRTRLVGNLGYSYTENVADSGPLSSYYIYDNVWVLTTGGAEFDVVPGPTSAALGLQFGVAWRKVDHDDTVGSPSFPAESTDRFSTYEVVVPSLTARHRLTSRANFMAGIHDHIFNLFDGTAKHSPALTVGLSFR